MIQRPFNPLLPDVPLLQDPLATGYLQELNDALNRTFQTFNVPGLITGVTATATGTRVFIQWNSDSASSVYRVYRNIVGDFNTATVVASVGASRTGVAQLSTQDVNDLTQPQLFYWVQGVNQRGEVGPQSAMQTVVNFETTGPIKTVINAVDSDLFYLDITASGQSAGLILNYTVNADDGSTGRQLATGIRAFNIYHNGTLNSANAQIGTELNTVTGGSLVLVWTVVAAGYGPVITLNATSSFGFDPTVYYTIQNNSDRAVTFR